MKAPKKLVCLGKTYTLIDETHLPWGTNRCEYKAPDGYFEIQIDYTNNFCSSTMINLWIDSHCANLPSIPLDKITLGDIKEEMEWVYSHKELARSIEKDFTAESKIFNFYPQEDEENLQSIIEAIHKADPRFVVEKEPGCIEAEWEGATFGNCLMVEPLGKGFEVCWEVYKSGNVVAEGRHLFTDVDLACQYGINSVLMSFSNLADVDFKNFED